MKKVCIHIAKRYLSPDYVDKGVPYIRLEPISSRKSYLLCRNELIKHVLNHAAGRGRQRIEGDLLDHIESVYNKYFISYIFLIYFL